MPTICLPRIGTVVAWRRQVRKLAAQGAPSQSVIWKVGEAADDLFAEHTSKCSSGFALRLSRETLWVIESALCHKDPERFARSYDIVLRLANKTLVWGDRSDRAMRELLAQAKSVGRDIHKMHAFVRFRDMDVPDAPRRRFAAWFEPEHYIVEAAAPFFANRFGDMDWIITTPDVTARFEAGRLSFEETANVAPLPDDGMEDLWRTYYSSTFNPARLMVSAMQSEMPKKYWKNLPEAALIPKLIRTAPDRVRAMHETMPTISPEHLARKKPARRALDKGINTPASASEPQVVQGDEVKPVPDAAHKDRQ